MLMSEKERRSFFVIVMGVSGSGKTTIGEKLAQVLGLPFLDADQLHPASNLNKMRSGIPLNDDDRLDWLQVISHKMSSYEIEASEDRRGLIIGCSALKVKYRRILRGFCLNYDSSSKPPIESEKSERHVHILYLKGTFEGLIARVQDRSGHFMPPTLLQSQFDTLEEPTDMEHIDSEGNVRGQLVTESIESDPETIVSRFMEEIQKSHSQRSSYQSSSTFLL